MADLAEIGVTGLAVMGRNLARNFARHGHRVAIHNRTYAKTQSLVDDHGDEGTFIPSQSMADFVASLERPRRVLIMVKAGTGTDAVIEELYLVTFSRPPDAAELAKAKEIVAGAPAKKEGFEDLLWALLNSREFLFKH